MKILWLTWKDPSHPLAGGAEVVNDELANRLVKEGHEVKFIVGGFENAETRDTRNGYEIIRLGNRFTVYYKAYKYYKANLQGWADLVIDEVNTIPFFAHFYPKIGKEQNILLIHQLAREIWFYQMFFPLNLIGFLLEPLYLWILSNSKVITISKSTKNDLLKYSFQNKKINIISVGIELEPVKDSVGLECINKYEYPTVLSLGAVRPMKQTLDILKAFEIAKKSVPKLKLLVAGSVEGKYGEKFINSVNHSKYRDSVTVLGKIDKTKKVELLQKSHAIMVTSVKEGWGLIVTEAASQGTPAIVYNVDGLRDSVRDKVTGLISLENTPISLSESLVSLLDSTSQYSTFRINAWLWSKEITFEKSFSDFKNALGIK